MFIKGSDIIKTFIIFDQNEGELNILQLKLFKLGLRSTISEQSITTETRRQGSSS